MKHSEMIQRLESRIQQIEKNEERILAFFRVSCNFFLFLGIDMVFRRMEILLKSYDYEKETCEVSIGRLRLL